MRDLWSSLAREGLFQAVDTDDASNVVCASVTLSSKALQKSQNRKAWLRVSGSNLTLDNKEVFPRREVGSWSLSVGVPPAMR